MTKFLPPVALIVLACAGCGPRQIDEGSGESKSKTAETNGELPKRPAPVSRDSIEGRWVMDFSTFSPDGQFMGYRPVGILDVARVKDPKPGESPYRATLVGEHVTPPVYRLLGSEITDTRARVLVQYDREFFDFDVERHGSEVRGTAQYEGRPHPARFYPSDEPATDKLLVAVVHKNVDQYRQAMSEQMNQQGPKELLEFVRAHPKSPLAFLALQAASPVVPPNITTNPKPARSELTAHLELMDRVAPYWGERAHLAVRVDFAKRLFGARLAPEIALRSLNRHDADGKPLPWSESYRPFADEYREVLEFELNFTAVQNAKDVAERDAAAARLEKRIAKKYPFHPYALYVLGEAARKSGRTDDALRQYARLVSLPGVADVLERDLQHRRQPAVDVRKTLQELWQERHKSQDGLEPFLAEVYDEAIRRLADVANPRHVPRRSRRTVLCELITGSECRGCVACDAVLDALGRAFAETNVRVLEYQLPAPKPGPLVNGDAKKRAFDYGAHSPPAFFVNGEPPTYVVNGRPLPIPLAGTLATCPPVYWTNVTGRIAGREISPVELIEVVRRMIELGDRSPPSPYRIELAGRVEGDVLNLSAGVEGPADAPPDLRFRLVLAEDHVDYKGSNGVRRHPMIARDLPLKTDGERLKNGGGRFQRKVDLKQLKRELLDDLAAEEERAGVKFPARPLELQNLHLVGFVQDKRDGRILQSASIVVQGSATYNLPPRFPPPVNAPRPRRKGLKDRATPAPRPDPKTKAATEVESRSRRVG